MTLGEKIKKIRKEKGWTQNDLGKLVNMHERQISKYEMNQIKPSSEVIIKIARALKTSSDYLLFDEETESKPSTYIKDIKLIELFEKIENMTNKEKETIISVIEAYVAQNEMK